MSVMHQNDSPPETRTAKCLTCGSEFQQIRFPHPSREMWLPQMCERCHLGTTAPVMPIDPDAERRAMRLRLLNVPHGYEHCTLDAFRDRGIALLARKLELAHAYVDAYRTEQKAPQSISPLLVLQGSHQTGKTHFALGLGRKLAVDLNVQVRYEVFADVVRMLRASWGGTRVDRDDREQSVLARHRAYSVLILDEVSSHALSSLGDCSAHLYDIVGDRWAQGRATFLISNDESGGALEQQLGPALTARIEHRRALWQFGTDPYVAEPT